MEKVPLTIIGGGVVGLAIAYELIRDGYKDVVLLEKNPGFGREQTERSAGVIHCAIFEKGDTLRGRLNIEGFSRMYEYCRKNDVPHKRAGKLVVAADMHEESILEDLLVEAGKNSLDARLISKDEIKKLEPCIEANSAIYCPDSGIIDSAALVSSLYAQISRYHNEPGLIMRNSQVMAIEPKGSSFRIDVSQPNSLEKYWSLETEVLINSAGLRSVDIARMAEPGITYEPYYLKGDFSKFRSREGLEVGMNVYRAPKIRKVNGHDSFLEYGIHITPQVERDGFGGHVLADEILVGPRFVETDDIHDHSSEGYSARPFYDSIKGMLPGISEGKLYLAHTGILGLLSRESDFVIEKSRSNPGLVNLLGMESPALTSSLAIGRYVRNMIKA